MKRSSNIFTRTLFLLFTGLSLMTAAGAQSPFPSSPAVPSPYSTPLFHAGGANALVPVPNPVPLVPRYEQLQGTPSGVFGGISTEVPSFLLGNYDPAQPPGGTAGSFYFPNHFRDGTVSSWSAPFTFLSAGASSPTALGAYNTTTPPPVPLLSHDVQSTPTAVNATEYPEITNAKYYGIAAGSISTADGTQFTGSKVPAPAGYTAATDPLHAIRQLVYFGRSEYIVDTRVGSPTLNKLIHVGAIYCANGFTGGIVWRYQTATVAGRDPSVFSSPAVLRINVITNTAGTVIANKLVVIVGDNNGFVYCLDAIGNGDGTSNSASTDALTNNQPIYDTTAASHVGTTTAYWVYRPDAGHPLDNTGVPRVDPLTGLPVIDLSADEHVPGAFGVASPNIYIEKSISTAPATQSNAIIYIGNTNGVLYALDGLGVPNVPGTPALTGPPAVTATTGPLHYNASIALPITNNTIQPTTPTTNPLWWFWPGGRANPNVSMESTPAILPPSVPATIPTVTIVTSSVNAPIAAGSSVTYTATVTDASGNAFVPTGTVDINVNGAASGPVALIAGTASFTSAALVTPGANPVTATYTPTGIFGPSTSPALTEVVQTGSSADRIVIVTSTSTNPTFPGGTVTFTGTAYDGNGAVLGTPTLTIDGVPAGTSPVTTSSLTVGSHTVTSAVPALTVASPLIQVVNGLGGPTVCIGTSSELGPNSNAGRLYAVDGFAGPKGFAGTVTTPGAFNYNQDQRPVWAFPNAYSGVGSVSGLGIRPALGNISGSPVVFSNQDVLVGGLPQTRIYFAANSGLEVPYFVQPVVPITPPLRDPDPRPVTGTTGRVWAVNTDGTIAKTVSTTPAITNIWAYPLAQDPNDKTFDRTPEPSTPMGSFLHATPAMGVVEFPTTIVYGTVTASPYVHTDSVNTTNIPGVRGKPVPMLYIGTQGVDDTGFYALDVNGFDDATRDIYRIESPTGAGFASSPALVTNSSTTGGNGGAVYVTAGNSLFQFGATPITNLNTAQAFPFISVDKTFTGFGPVSSPTPAAADVSDLTPGFTLYGGANVTDWIYVGDGTTGFCRGITPVDPNYGGIVPPANYGGVIDSVPPDSIDARYPLRTFLFDNAVLPVPHPKGSTDMNQANPLGGAITTFEWGEYSYVRIANVVPPGPFLPATPDATKLVQDPIDPTIFYGNGSAVTFKIGDVSDANVYAPTTTIPAVNLAALTGAPTDNGFIKRTGLDRPEEIADPTSVLKDTPTGKGWIAAYSYPIGSYRTRSGDTPGARRRVTEAHQTATAYRLVGITFTAIPGTVTLEAQTLQGNQTANAVTKTITQSKPTVQPTFGILNPLALRGAGIPYALSGPTSATELGVPGGIGPFRALNSPILPNNEDLQALTNGNSVYTNNAPPSGYDASQDPTQASSNRLADAGTYPKAYKLIATSLGQVRDGSTGENSDPNPAPAAVGNFSTVGNGLVGTGYGAALLNVADRSLLGSHLFDMDPLNLSQKLFPPYPVAMQRASAHWNDNTGYNGPGACVNRLPWEELPSAVSANTSRDYPDIAAAAIKHTLITNAGTTQEITGRRTESTTEQILDPANPGTDDQHRIIVLDPIKITMEVPKYQPANLQVWDASQYQTSTGVTNTTNTQAAIPPDRINSSHTIFPEGYVEGAGGAQRVFIDLNHNGICDNNEPYRDVQVFSGVAVNMQSSLDGSTVDVGPVPSSFGILTDLYTPQLGAFSPYTAPYQNKYLSVTAHNDGNVNLLNVHFDQKISSFPQTLLLNSDTLDPSSYIPAFDYSTVGISGPSAAPGRYLLRSSLDTDLLGSGRNLVVAGGVTDPVTGNAVNGQFPSYTFHKPRIGGSATTLTVPDSPEVSSSYYMPPSANGLPVVGSTALPYVSVAVPFGTPIGTYSQTMRLFEGIDTGGYATYNGSGYNPLYPPQYGGAVGGLGVPSGTPNDVYQVSQQPLSDPGVVIKTSVLEDRLTDGLTYGAIPQIDGGQAGTSASGPISTPDFAPAAFQAVGGNLSLFWTSGRAGSNLYGIYGALATYSAPAYLPVTGGQSWFAPNNPTLMTSGTNSGLSVAQEAPYLSGGVFTSDAALAFAFAVNVNTAPYQNSLYCYPVTPNSGVLGAAQLVTSDPAQVKYGVRGVYCPGASFPGNSNLWAFWTGSTRGRTAIYYNQRIAKNDNSPWPNNTLLLPIPAGLTAVSDAAPMLILAPITASNGTVTLNKMIEVTFTGTAADGNSDLYACRYLPVILNGSNVPELVLQSFTQVTEQLKPIGGWLQARDVAWSRAAGVNILVGGVGVLYDTATGNSLFKNVTFDRASGLLVYTGVSLTPGTANTFTNTLYVDISTGRVRFVTIPTGTVTATFTPQARRITEDSRADTGVVTFLDPTFKPNEGPGLGRVQADRRWYIWRKSGISGTVASASLYQKAQRLTIFQPNGQIAVVGGVTKVSSIVVGGTDITSLVDVDVALGRFYFPINASGTITEGQQATITYTPASTVTSGQLGGAPTTINGTIQWQDEVVSNTDGTPPTDTISGLSMVKDTAVPISKPINENNPVAFLDTNAYNDLQALPTAAKPDYPHKLWLFWNSTRNGTADLYYQTLNPRFTATGP